MYRTPKPEDVLLSLSPSAPRLVLGLGALVALGFILLYVAFSGSTSLGAQAFLIGCGILSLYAADQMRRTAAMKLELTGLELREATTGRVLADLANVEKVERGAFAFKPSNGFSITLKSSMPRAYVPGLWWRFGRKIGIGGVIRGGEARAMAEMMVIQVHERDNGKLKIKF